MLTLQAAIDAMVERKTALLSDSIEGEGAEASVDVDALSIGQDGLRLLCSGMDLDINELTEASDACGHTMLIMTVLGGYRISKAIGGAWIDGVMTGLVLAELRAREEQRA